MASKGTWHVGQRTMLVDLVNERGVSVTKAAEFVGLSRQSAHKWLERMEQSGLAGLEDASRARKTQRRFEGVSVEKLLALRLQHRTWGARHLLAQMRRREPRLKLPSASTLTEFMRRAGLLSKRSRQKRHTPVFGQRKASAPNDIWTIDFKGQFRLRNGQMCFPLTIRDHFSKKVLRVVACANTKHPAVLAALKSAFGEFGLPRILHSDTGAPFGSTGLGRLSQVSVYVMRLGILPTFSRPGKPQDNGGHERMHLDLKMETTMPAAFSMAAQQKRFATFIRCFNEERLHQALAMETPDSVWRPSTRRASSRTEAKYDAGWEIRRIDRSGKMAWRGQNVFIARVLKAECIALEPVDQNLWRIHFFGFPIAFLCESGSSAKVEDLSQR